MDTARGEDKKLVLSNIIPDPKAVNPSEAVVQTELQKKVKKLLKKVDGLSASVLRLSFGLEDGIEYTPTEIARMLRIPHSKVVRLKQNSLRILKNYRRPVEDYLQNPHKPSPRKRIRKKHPKC